MFVSKAGSLDWKWLGVTNTPTYFTSVRPDVTGSDKLTSLPQYRMFDALDYNTLV